MFRFLGVVCAGLGCAFFWGVPVYAQTVGVSYNLNGAPGLVDMPTAEMANDADFATSVSRVADVTKTTLHFQIAKRLSGSFRYSVFEEFGRPGGESFFDRSFDLRYRLWDEGNYRPALAIGLNDFIGTGKYSAEYIVASKTITPGLTLSAGIGWGRLGSEGGFENPLGLLHDGFKDRAPSDYGRGGKLQATEWFQGNAGVFGGVSWSPNDKLTLKAEYSSDAYALEETSGLIERNSPFNFGVEYRVGDGARLQLYQLHGDKVGAGLTLELNPKKPAFSGHMHEGPIPFASRPAGAPRDLGWTSDVKSRPQIEAAVATVLGQAGIGLRGFQLDPDVVALRVENYRYNSNAEVLGRTARVLSRVLPASVETISISLAEDGIDLVTATMLRSDLEEAAYRPDAAETMFERTALNDAAHFASLGVALPAPERRFSWSVGPYLAISYFDPDNPARVDFGAAALASFSFTSQLSLNAEAQMRLVGNLDSSRRESNSEIQRVRSEANRYNRASSGYLGRLTADYYARPGKDLYAHLSAGYLERMFAGVSGELLWKRVDLPLALGVEISAVKQRAFGDVFALSDYETVTGHVSAYWQMPNDLHAQLDLGRYLAKDWGATLTVDREFANGWRIGAYATLTDVPFDKFGEGSFDKGLRFIIPLTHFLGQPSRKRFKGVLQPLSRDGGAKINVSGRLYETIRAAHKDDLEESWGRFWR